MARKRKARRRKTRLGASRQEKQIEKLRAENSEQPKPDEDEKTAPSAVMDDDASADDAGTEAAANLDASEVEPADESADDDTSAAVAEAEAAVEVESTDAEPVAVEGDTGDAAFTEADWEDLSYSLMAEQADPPPCPECGRNGFYGPRALDGGRKFHQCRFCGFFQDIGKAPVRLQAVAHNCEQWPEVAGAPYLWWIPTDEEWYICNFCSKRTAVHGSNPFVKGAAVTAPSDDPEHAWRNVPEHASYDTYYKFWEQWPVTKGRAFL